MTDQKHPDQPLYKDEDGKLRFKQNAIIRYLMDAGSIDFNQLAMIPFNSEDRKQFYQLIGYTWSGFQELGLESFEEYNKVRIEWEEKE